MTSIRTFLAIKLPAAVQDRLLTAGTTYRKQLPPRSVRWVSKANLHLTLWFLGKTDVAKLPALCTDIDALASQVSPFTLTLSRLGCFPKPKRPNVVWVGIDGWLAPQIEFRKGLDQLMMEHGFKPETRPYTPHLTLGYVKHHHNEVAALPFGQAFSPLPIAVSAIHLMESQLQPSGPVYTIQHTSFFDSST